MSFQMYVNNSDNRYINKSLTALGSALPCSFKDDTTMENPVIILSPGSYNPGCNYAFLSDTGRYYYVVDVTYSQQRIEVSLKVDVLYTFLINHATNTVVSNKCIASRSSNRYNSYLTDDRYPRLQYGNPTLKLFPKGFSKNNCCVMTVAGGV